MSKAQGIAQSANQGNFKNRLINGDCRIDQRNNGASVSLADGIYNLDRFQGSVSQASKITVQRSSTAPVGFINSQILTVSSTMTIGAGDYCGNAQAIEGFNTSDLGFGTANAQSVTVSFWVRSSITGTYSVALHNAAFNRTCAKGYTINAANTWEYKTITFTGDTSGTWLTDNSIGIKVYFALSMGSTYGGGTDGAWSSTPKLAVTGQTQWATNSGATFYITGVQLEKGSTATSFDYRPYGTELVLCQRYFELFTFKDYSLVGQAYLVSAAYALLFFTVQKRVAPTVTLPATGSGSNQITFTTSSLGVPSTIGTNSVIEASVSKISILGSGYTSAFNVGNAAMIYGSGNPVVQISAEL